MMSPDNKPACVLCLILFTAGFLICVLKKTTEFFGGLEEEFTIFYRSFCTFGKTLRTPLSLF